MHVLNGLAQGRGVRQRVLLRVSPSVDSHTHLKTTTGTTDVKFGIAIVTGQAEHAVRQLLDMPGLEFVGLHAHLGSPIFETEPFAQAVDVVFDFAAAMREKYGFEMQEFSPGGGFAVDYVPSQDAPTPDEYADVVVSAVRAAIQRTGLAAPRMFIEPGRSIVARAAVAVYTAGSSKDIPGVRRYVSVDGGMADNIRPAMYESKYAAIIANKPLDPASEKVTIAGKYCESGDVLIRDIELPPLEPGDVLVTPAAGAYALAMASNYNASLRPAVVLVANGEARLMRRRETYEDLMRADVWPLE
jgi:diaminopimelate decarboxylase